MTRPLILTLTAALMSACAPTVTRPKEIVIDGFKIEPGQHWVVKAQGGKGWTDGVEGVVGKLESTSQFVAYDLGEAKLQYTFASSRINYPVDALTVIWDSKAEQLVGESSYCSVRAPKLSSTKPPTLQGRWAASITRLGNYERTGDITGTGICTITLVR